MGGEGHTADLAVLYLRISAIGIAVRADRAGRQGYLRGVSNLAAADRGRGLQLVNVVLEVPFVYGFDWGIAGSAWVAP